MATKLITPEHLHDRGRFAVVWEMDHKALVRALQPFIWKRSRVSAVYIAANVLALAFAALIGARADVGLMQGFSLVCLGMLAGYVVLLPVHEGLHALAYRAMGARDVHVRYRWRALTAFCAADRFVVDRRALVLVCLAPFVVLNPLLAAAAWLSPGAWSVVMAGALLLHVGACSGDLGLVNWLWLEGGDDVLSYDDVGNGRTYFFRPLEDVPSGT